MKAAQFLTCLLLPFAFLLLPLFLVLFQLAAGYPVPSAQLDEVVPALELHTHVEEPSRDSERRGDEGRVRVREPEQEARGREQRDRDAGPEALAQKAARVLTPDP